MGKHRGNPDPNEMPGLEWKPNADPQHKADNFDAYDRHLKDNAGEGKSNPYSKGNFGK